MVESRNSENVLHYLARSGATAGLSPTWPLREKLNTVEIICDDVESTDECDDRL